MKRYTLTDQVADGLVDLIKERALKEGDAIPATGELASRFNVSRPVVREALAELAGRGLLRRQQGREGVFTVPGSHHLRQLLAHRLDHEHVTFEALQEFREVVEIGAARLAASRASAEANQALEECLEMMRGARGDDYLHDADVDFHRAVASASGNPLFVLILDALSPLLRDSRQRAWMGWIAQGGKLADAIDNHAAIAERIGAHDEDGAVEAMRHDLGETRRGLEALSS